MTHLQLIFLALLPLTTVAQDSCPALTSACTTYTNVANLQTTNYDSNKHYYIGGLFNIHKYVSNVYKCNDAPIASSGILNLEAFMYAIRTYSKDVDVSVGGLGLDTCSRSAQVAENVLSFETCKVRIGEANPVSPRNLLAYVGTLSEDNIRAIAKVTKDTNKTMISSATGNMELLELSEYLQITYPNVMYDSMIIAALLQQYESGHVMILHEDSDYGMKSYLKLAEHMKAQSICIGFHKTVSEETDLQQLAIDLLARYTFRYVVLFMERELAYKVVTAVSNDRQNGYKISDMLFFGTSLWGKDTSFTSTPNARVLNPILAVPPAISTDVDNFYNYFDGLKHFNNTWNNKWFKAFWDQECPACTDDITLLGKYTRDEMVPYTMLAVKAVIDGVKEQAVKVCANNFLCPSLLNTIARGQGFNIAINNTKYITNRMLSQSYVKYNIHYHESIGKTEFGIYTPNSLTISGTVSKAPGRCPNATCIVCGIYPTTTTTTEKPTTTPIRTTTYDETEGGKYSMVKFLTDQRFTGVYRNQPRDSDSDRTRFSVGQKWIIALGVLAALGILAVIIFEIYILQKLLGTQIGRQWRTMWLGQLLLFAIFLSYLTLFAYLFVPTKATCGITRFGVGVCYAMIYAVLLVKLMVILTSKASESILPGDVESPNYLKGIYQFLMFIFAVGVQVVIDAQWLIQVPPDAVQVMDNTGQKVWICNHYTWSGQNWDSMPDFVFNEFENHLLSLVYVMFLILVTTFVAMRAHGIITNHRESVFIGIVSGFSIPIWVAWGLVGGLNRDHAEAHQFGDACLAYGLFLCATLALFAMFLPKVRQLVNMGMEGIYLEDDRDTYYAGSVVMAPPSYKSRPSSVIYANSAGGIYSDPVVLGNGDPHANYIKHPGTGSTYSAPAIYSKRGDTIGSSKVLRVTGDLTGKHPNKPVSEVGYYRKAQSESGGTLRGTLRKSKSMEAIGAL